MQATGQAQKCVALFTWVFVHMLIVFSTRVFRPIRPIYGNLRFFHEWGPDERWGGLRVVEIHIVAMRVLFVVVVLFPIKQIGLPAHRHSFCFIVCFVMF